VKWAQASRETTRKVNVRVQHKNPTDRGRIGRTVGAWLASAGVGTLPLI